MTYPGVILVVNTGRVRPVLRGGGLAERKTIISWAIPNIWDERFGPRGIGNFMIKIGRRSAPLPQAITPTDDGPGHNRSHANWIIPSIVSVLIAVTAAAWGGSGMASMLSGHGWDPAPIAPSTVRGLLADGTSAYWPGTDPRLIMVLTAILAILALIPIAVTTLLIFSRRRPVRSSPHRARLTAQPGTWPGPFNSPDTSAHSDN